MRPCSLEKAASITITQTLLQRVKNLDITKEYDRGRLVEVLVSVAYPATSKFCYLSSWVLKRELNWLLLYSLVSEVPKDEAVVYLTSMLVLCPDVDFCLSGNSWYFPTNAPNYRDTLPQEACHAILKTIDEFQECQATLVGGETTVNWEGGSLGGKSEADIQKRGDTSMGGEEEGMVRKLAPLPTKSLVFGDLQICDETFFSRLVEKMPNLQSVKLLKNTNDSMIKALSHHCRSLQEIKLYTDGEVVSLLFGVPQHVVKNNLLEKLCEGMEDFWQIFVPQFPNLRMLELMSASDKYVARILALLLQPELEFLGRKFPLTLHEVTNLCKVWRAIHHSGSNLPVLPLRHAVFSEELCRVMTQPESQDLVALFGNLRCVEMEGGTVSWQDFKLVENIIRLFSSTMVTAMSLPNVWQNPDPTILAHLEHVRLKHTIHTELHTLLDSCPNLSTLSIKIVVISKANGGSCPHRHTHTKLTTLCINRVIVRVDPIPGVPWGDSYIAEQHKFAETVLHYIMRRLSNLHSLTLSSWCEEDGYDGCSHVVITFLESIVTQAHLANTPVLTHLEELSCLDSGGIENIHRTILTLVRSLPTLRRLCLPSSRRVKFLEQSINYLQGTHVKLGFGSRAEEAFYG